MAANKVCGWIKVQSRDQQTWSNKGVGKRVNEERLKLATTGRCLSRIRHGKEVGKESSRKERNLEKSLIQRNGRDLCSG